MCLSSVQQTVTGWDILKAFGGTMSKLCRLSIGLFFVLSVVWAQFETSEVLGTVRDNTGAVLQNVDVTLTNQDTGITAKTVSDESGQYDFFNVRVGRYTVSAERP